MATPSYLKNQPADWVIRSDQRVIHVDNAEEICKDEINRIQRDKSVKVCTRVSPHSGPCVGWKMVFIDENGDNIYDPNALEQPRCPIRYCRIWVPHLHDEKELQTAIGQGHTLKDVKVLLNTDSKIDTNAPVGDFSTTSGAVEDKVNHPTHYTAYHGVEIIEITEDMDFCLGNAVKYVARAGVKDSDVEGKEIEDLRKGLWYIDREVERLNRYADREGTDAIYLHKVHSQTKVDILVGQMLYHRGAVISHISNAHDKSALDAMKELVQAHKHLQLEIARMTLTPKKSAA